MGMLQIVLLFLAGIAFLLYGILALSQIMQKLVSKRFRIYLNKITSKPIYGLGFGTIFTTFFQSSSATSALTISLVSAGLLSFFASLGIIFGANIGTTITAQLVAFKITTVAPFIMVAGLILFLSNKVRIKMVGKAIFYFGMLFFGLELIGKAASILSNRTAFVDLLLRFENPLLAIAVSAAITALLQSSSAVTGIIVMLGTTEAITLKAAIPLVLGANIGTTVTAIIASIGGGISAKRTALAHLLFNIIGVLIFLPFLVPFTSLAALTSSNLTHQIANAHLIFNFVMAGIFLAIIMPFSKLIEKIIPGKEKIISLWPHYIDDRYLVKPELALSAVKKEITRALAIINEMFKKASNTIFRFNKKRAIEIDHYEKVTDSLNFELHNYLGKLSVITKKENLAPYVTLINDIERIADRSVNLVEIAEVKQRHKIEFSESTKKAMRTLIEAVSSSINNIKELNVHYSARLFRKINERNAHIIKALEHLKMKAEKGFVSLIYSELVENLERIVEHCQNAAKNIKAIKMTPL